MIGNEVGCFRKGRGNQMIKVKVLYHLPEDTDEEVGGQRTIYHQANIPRPAEPTT